MHRGGAVHHLSTPHAPFADRRGDVVNAKSGAGRKGQVLWIIRGGRGERLAYSLRSASTGSTRIARLAGITLANSVTTVNTAATTASVVRSEGST